MLTEEKLAFFDVKAAWILTQPEFYFYLEKDLKEKGFIKWNEYLNQKMTFWTMKEFYNILPFINIDPESDAGIFTIFTLNRFGFFRDLSI